MWRTPLLLLLAAVMAVPARAQDGAKGPWRTNRPVRAVVLGGSISRYYAGNFGQYLQYGCSDLEVLNRGEVGAGASKILKNLKTAVLDEPDTRQGLGWVVVQGGLNSVWSPESTSWWLSRLFSQSHGEGLKVLALSLSPWGSDDDPRFDGWKALRLHRATEQVVEFVLGHLTPAQALGRRAAQRGGDDQKWQPGELPDIAIDLWRSPLRAGSSAPLRPREELADAFGRSPWAKQAADKDKWIQAARAVPQQFLAKPYHDFDHVHPNGAGHRLIAALVCQQAPAEWRCDCDAIRRAVWKGKIVPGKS
ncbi:MAG: SGNH/GDSL hydrolase family protein [Deltaproteobacteria bacterium]|nr:SGNH/GDSL hydrolase family protein [Deltaproteobacteria bacterium]